MNDIPLPKDPRHQRLADLHATRGMSLVDAYLEVGFKVSRRVAAANAHRIMKRPDVVAYLAAIRQEQAAAAHLSITEILTFCARVVRTGIGDLDPTAGSATGDLIKSYAATEGELASSSRIEKLCPFRAIDTHLKLSGEDPQTNALKDLAAAIGSLGGEVLPSDRM